MKNVKITLEDAKAELRDAATGPDCQNWRYSPAVKALLNSHDELLVALGEMKQRAEAAEQRLQQPKAKPSILDVIAERQRQIRKGSDADHDDGYIDGVLALGGAAYAISGAGMNGVGTYRKRAKNLWPFPLKTFNPAGNAHRREDLIRGAAMIIAEIDKMDRATAKVEGE
ncbi:Uncharacterised protein [Serratia fonticola]|uniref:hypothetical protein n=1 Tax=Serratia fonticola TaxID=47917 RepID=UPI0021771BCE|nr:hypothetical protein [Serratia fonticola]CAI1703054.1 Uncharacterised protein [Serratia fonticola]